MFGVVAGGGGGDRLRDVDIVESCHLLLELLCSEPSIQECLQVIENMCVSRDLDFTIDGKPPSPEFARFVNRHYIPFLRLAIRQAHGLGFVAWCVRKLPSGDSAPEALPLGSFSWRVIPDETRRSTLRYDVKLASGIPDVKVHVKEWIQPSFNVCEGSILHATVQTPLSHLIEEYQILRETTRRLHKADAWNTTARIIVASDPKEFNHDSSQKEIFETLDFLKSTIDSHRGDGVPGFRGKAVSPVVEAFESRPSNHAQLVYELPPHHHIEQTPVLQSIVNLDVLRARFRRSVCALMGIPPELVSSDTPPRGGSSSASSSSAPASGSGRSGGGRSTSRLFQNKMRRTCLFLSALLAEAYEEIYGASSKPGRDGDDAAAADPGAADAAAGANPGSGAGATSTVRGVQFNLVTMPRLEVEGIADLKILHDIGVLQPDHAVKLSELLLGGGPARRQPPPHAAAAAARPLTMLGENERGGGATAAKDRGGGATAAKDRGPAPNKRQRA